MFKLVKVLGLLVFAQALEVESTAESELTATSELELEAECEAEGIKCRKLAGKRKLCPGGKCRGSCGGDCLGGCRDGKCLRKVGRCHCKDTMKKGKDCGCHGKEVVDVVKTVSYGDHNCPIKRSADGRCPIKTRKPVSIKSVAKKDCSCKSKKPELIVKKSYGVKSYDAPVLKSKKPELIVKKSYGVKSYDAPVLKSVRRPSVKGHLGRSLRGIHGPTIKNLDVVANDRVLGRSLKVVSHDLDHEHGLGLGL